MGTVTYPNQEVTKFITDHMIPLQIQADAKPWSVDFNVHWTPNIIILDQEGKEHHRIIGFLPTEEFIPSLMLGIAKVHFDHGRFNDALDYLNKIPEVYPSSNSAPEALYMSGVSHYKITHDAQSLKEAYQQLNTRYPSSIWTKRAYPYRLL